jgi:hypothetical protein
MGFGAIFRDFKGIAKKKKKNKENLDSDMHN